MAMPVMPSSWMAAPLGTVMGAGGAAGCTAPLGCQAAYMSCTRVVSTSTMARAALQQQGQRGHDQQSWQLISAREGNPPRCVQR